MFVAASTSLHASLGMKLKLGAVPTLVVVGGEFDLVGGHWLMRSSVEDVVLAKFISGEGLFGGLGNQSLISGGR